MRLCCVLAEQRIFLIDHEEAPPTIEFNDYRSGLPRIRILERLTKTADPVAGIVCYEEVERT